MSSTDFSIAQFRLLRDAVDLKVTVSQSSSGRYAIDARAPERGGELLYFLVTARGDLRMFSTLDAAARLLRDLGITDFVVVNRSTVEAS